ncbi:ChbG/HpnK family deacetylase, partial [Acidimicrobiaceae bacterium USS-CC1]|nr:ChbG/HpnK family deacetylase [Acidiferrimicrobium australe]
MSDLAAALGRDRDARLLIVTCDELGVTHAHNAGVYASLRDGMATSAGLVVPGPWAREAAARYRGEDVGVHLTLNAEYDLLRWGPITHCPSLLDGDGGFPRTLEDLWEHGDTEEVRRECRA